MMNKANFPKTLLEAVKYFADRDNSLAFMVQIHWPEGVTCPWCDSPENSFLLTRRVWKCKACRKQFSAKAGTIFEDSPIGLDKWFPAVWMIVNMKNGISSYELGKALGVTQKTAWFMNHRIRKAMQCGTFRKLAGHVEVDETYIGGKARNMHRGALAKRVDKHATPYTGRNQNIGKVAVMGLLERNGEVRTMVVPNTKRKSLHGEVSKHVEQGSTVYSDALRSYRRLEDEYIHNVINHAVEYVRGNVHTNGIENFWALLKRTIGGTYVSVEPFHLFRYLDEQSFRFNTRKATDSDRFIQAAMSITGKRLTFDELTGKEPAGYQTTH
jgi:transposase-like protein